MISIPIENITEHTQQESGRGSAQYNGHIQMPSITRHMGSVRRLELIALFCR